MLSKIKFSFLVLILCCAQSQAAGDYNTETTVKKPRNGLIGPGALLLGTTALFFLCDFIRVKASSNPNAKLLVSMAWEKICKFFNSPTGMSTKGSVDGTTDILALARPAKIEGSSLAKYAEGQFFYTKTWQSPMTYFPNDRGSYRIKNGYLTATFTGELVNISTGNFIINAQGHSIRLNKGTPEWVIAS